ncbi:MFS transporter [Ancylobacter sp. 6x-1]|uniref:MFS transporter n=1 Tax=Ancylobacter crimeensis TaxID=2579147 RepID=A0ABT0DCN8_9HYPH|nr:MFS transporter [Ancylobacter crimeensis]MCK0197726.1 MFS transporter [Ancylobacter crimeensis]
MSLALSPPSPRGAFISALGLGQVCSWGSLYYSFPLIAEAMRLDLGWSKTGIYGAATLGLVLGGLAAYPVGAAIDRGHGRLVMTAGSLLAGVLLALWSQVHGVIAFYVCVGGIGLLQAATLYDPAFAVVARRSGALHARAGITALTLWGGFSSTVFIPLVQALLVNVGWRETLLVLAAVNILLCAGLYGSVIDPTRDQPAPPPPERARPGESGPVRWVLRQPTFWALAVAFTLYSAVFTAFSYHLYPLLSERGLGPAGIVAVMAVIGPAQVAGRLALWLLAPRASVRRIGVLMVPIFPVVMGMLAFGPNVVRLLVGLALLFGATNGIMTIVRGLAIPEMLTPRAYGAVNGLLAAPSAVSRAVAPLAMATLWSLSGSYEPVLIMLTVMSLLLTLAFWLAAALGRRTHIP